MTVADLHLHSTASDGLLTPSQTIQRAAELRIGIVALTDHDTTEGIPEAMAAGRELAVRVVTGVEISTELDGEEVHILGYKFNPDFPGLQNMLTKLKQARAKRILDITDRLANLGFDITRKEVLAASGNTSSIGRPHIARVMVAKGFAGSVGEVFERWIGPGCPAFVKRYKLTPTDAIEIIRSAGGLAFLAHAGLLNRGLTVADCLLSQGLDGIEVFHTEHSQEQVEGFLQYVRERDIYLSGGSDCHGNPRHMLMGSVRVDAQLVEPWLI